MLERYAVKVARTVLRRGSGSNATPLSDYLTCGILRHFRAFSGFEFFLLPSRVHVPPTIH